MAVVSLEIELELFLSNCFVEFVEICALSSFFAWIFLKVHFAGTVLLIYLYNFTVIFLKQDDILTLEETFLPVRLYSIKIN